MLVNKYYIIMGFLLACVSCIVPYEPDIDEAQKMLVISGIITDKAGLHYVTVSRTVPYNEPKQTPVSACLVKVEDQDGNFRQYNERSPGIYEVNLETSFLGVGKAYFITVYGPFGTEYRSEYDTLFACPPIDSVYYEVESQATSTPGVSYPGIQFYNDMKGLEDGVRTFRWVLYETWEYDAPLEADGIAYDTSEIIEFPGYEMLKCYRTRQIPSLFISTTSLLTENRLKRNALNFVSNQTPRLFLKYSLLVEQHSLSKEAFMYWDRLRSSLSESGGLYENQPISSFGNIHNVNDPEDQVLGLFYATQVQSKRIMVNSGFEFKIKRLLCVSDTIRDMIDLGGQFPFYLKSIGPRPLEIPFVTGSLGCFDCREHGGVTEKPDYW